MCKSSKHSLAVKLHPPLSVNEWYSVLFLELEHTNFLPLFLVKILVLSGSRFPPSIS